MEQLVSIRSEWYEAIKKCEKLVNFVSGCDGSFTQHLKEIQRSLRNIESELNKINPELKKIFPEKREEIDKYTEDISGCIVKIIENIDKNIREIDEFRELSGKIKKYEEELVKVERELEEIEKELKEVCEKYNTRKEEFERVKSRIIGGIEKQLYDVKKKFIRDLTPLTEGYEIYIGGEKKEIEKLFDELLNNPNKIEHVKIIKSHPKKSLFGIFKGKDEEKIHEARNVVLKYLAEEVIEKAVPLRKKKEETILKLEVEFGDLKGVEIACKKAMRRKESVEKTKKELVSRIEELRKKPEMEYAKYNKILSLREEYLERFEECKPLIKEFLNTFGELIEKYEPVEEDVEKRELRKEVRELRSKNSKLKSELIDAKKQINNLLSENKKLNAELKEFIKKIEEAENIIESLKKEKEKLEKKLNRIKEILK